MGASALAALVLHMAAAVAPYDDAYITFRYVENILSGRGPVYNAGEPVLGVSCPLFLGWLVLLKGMLPSVPLPGLAARANAIPFLACVLLAWRLMLALRVRPMGAAGGAAAIALSDGILRPSLGAMETPLFLAIAFGSLLALMNGSSPGAGRAPGAAVPAPSPGGDRLALLLASLAALTRPEGLLLVGVCLVFCRRLRDGAVGLLPLAAWGVAAAWLYGSPVPQSVIAKAKPLYPLPAGHALRHLLEQVGRWGLDGLIGWRGSSRTAAWFVAAGAVLTVTAFAGWRPVVRTAIRRGTAPGPARRSLALPAFLAALILFYAIANPLLLDWYLPLLQAPWIAVLAMAAFPPPCPRAGERPAPRWSVTRASAAGAFALVLVCAAIVTGYHLTMAGDRNLPRHGATGARAAAQLDAYARAGSWLRSNAPEGATVAAAEIGRLGYELDRPILDACGLVTPAAVPFLPPPPDERGAQLGPIPTAFVRAAQPDYVVTLPAFAERSLLRSAWFSSAYGLVHEEPFIPGSPRWRAVLIYGKGAAPAP